MDATKRVSHNYALLVISLIALCLIGGSSQSENNTTDQPEQNYKNTMTIPRDSLPHLLAAELNEELTTGVKMLLVDVRTRMEYDGGHLAGAIQIDYEDITVAANKGQLGEKNDLIVLYCRSGNRSSTAIRELLALGYSNIRHVDDGFREWFNLGLPFYTVQGEVTGVKFEKSE